MKTLKELREKKLTPAEKKKREEIAKAIEKDQPDMPMDKKMAIATAQAKKVAEAKKLDEISPKLARKAAAASAAKSFEYGSSAYDDESQKYADHLDKKSDKAYAHVMKRQGQRGINKTNRLASKLIFGKSRYMESVEVDEAAPKLKGNNGPYTRQQIEKAAKEAKVDMGAKARMMMKLRDMK